MRNLKLTLAYDGSEFSGWQVQPGVPTIQGMLASAIGRLTGEKVLPQGSGRTDAGVHALAQVATFATESAIPVENWVTALNDILPASIRVLEVSQAPPEFHARKSARAKTYRYRMYRQSICPPFLARYVWHYPYSLDEAAMQQAAALVMIGETRTTSTSFAAVDPERGLEDSGVRNNEVSKRYCGVFCFRLVARRGGIDLHGARERFSAPHGQKSGRDFSAGRERFALRSRCEPNSPGAEAVSRGRDESSRAGLSYLVARRVLILARRAT